MIKIEDIYKFVLENNPPIEEVIPEYKITINYYDRSEEILTKDLSILKDTPCPNAHIDFLNEKEYDIYHKKIYEFKDRAEYIWYLILKHSWLNVKEEEFEEIYKNMWDKYYKEGGWDLVAHNMEEYYKFNYSQSE
jgi:hypothetical protein